MDGEIIVVEWEDIAFEKTLDKMARRIRAYNESH